jgi:hypothetical protein
MHGAWYVVTHNWFRIKFYNSGELIRVHYSPTFQGKSQWQLEQEAIEMAARTILDMGMEGATITRDTLKEQVRLALLDSAGFFEMEVVGDESQALADAWGQGIDSHLEGVTAPSTYEVRIYPARGGYLTPSQYDDTMKGTPVVAVKLWVKLWWEHLFTILRRLHDMADFDKDEAAESLRTYILDGLDLAEEYEMHYEGWDDPITEDE